jgi:hypothetical protein
MKRWWTTFKLIKWIMTAPTWIKVPLATVLLLVLLLIPVLGVLALLVVPVLVLVSFILAPLGHAVGGLVGRLK